jgi:hypothetical protein
MHANPQVRYRFQDRRLRPLGHPPGARVYPAAADGRLPDVPESSGLPPPVASGLHLP